MNLVAGCIRVVFIPPRRAEADENASGRGPARRGGMSNRRRARNATANLGGVAYRYIRMSWVLRSTRQHRDIRGPTEIVSRQQVPVKMESVQIDQLIHWGRLRILTRLASRGTATTQIPD